jgi:RNA polymerase sigma factor (sigma-70 family)
MYTSDVNVRGSAEGIEDFQNVRPRLFRIAYRMLGRVPDAEDIVQDVWVRWQGTDRARVNDRVAFLVRTTTNAALNVAASARFRREVTVDRPMMELVPAHEDPTLRAERLDDVENAVRLLVQRLSPIERAVFVLREAFGYRFGEIAEVLAISNANARQLARRARVRLAERRCDPTSAPAPAVDSSRLAKAFLAAAQDGAVADLERVLIEDVIAHYERTVSHPVSACRHPHASSRARPAPSSPGSLSQIAGLSGLS